MYNCTSTVTFFMFFKEKRHRRISEISGALGGVSLYSPYYAEACNEFAVPNSTS